MMKASASMILIALILAACVPQIEETKPAEVKNTTPVQPAEQPKPVVVTPSEEEPILLNKSINTLYNDRQQKFKWGTYVIELLSVSSDNDLCNIRINGQSGYYEVGSEEDFDGHLRVEVLEAFTTHGFTGDACKVALYNPN